MLEKARGFVIHGFGCNPGHRLLDHVGHISETTDIWNGYMQLRVRRLVRFVSISELGRGKIKSIYGSHISIALCQISTHIL